MSFIFRRNVLQLNVFYQSVITEVTKEKPAYDIHDFGCKEWKQLLLLLLSLVIKKQFTTAISREV